MATHGDLFLKMMACGDRLQEALRLEEKASSSAVPSKPLTGLHRALLSKPRVFQYGAVVLAMNLILQ